MPTKEAESSSLAAVNIASRPGQSKREGGAAKPAPKEEEALLREMRLNQRFERSPGKRFWPCLALIDVTGLGIGHVCYY